MIWNLTAALALRSVQAPLHLPGSSTARDIRFLVISPWTTVARDSSQSTTAPSATSRSKTPMLTLRRAPLGCSWTSTPVRSKTPGLQEPLPERPESAVWWETRPGASPTPTQPLTCVRAQPKQAASSGLRLKVQQHSGCTAQETSPRIPETSVELLATATTVPDSTTLFR